MVLTGIANAVKGELVALNHKPVLRTDGLVQLFPRVNVVEVQDSAAALANKVTVGPGVPVEVLLPVDHAHALDGPLLLENSRLR